MKEMENRRPSSFFSLIGQEATLKKFRGDKSSKWRIANPRRQQVCLSLRIFFKRKENILKVLLISGDAEKNKLYKQNCSKAYICLVVALMLCQCDVIYSQLSGK